MEYQIAEDRGIITVLQDRYVVSKEFVETTCWLSCPRLLVEYAHVLQARSRLVVVVPLDDAVQTRLRMLELNNWWLFYYQIHFYAIDGTIHRMDRRTWKRLRQLPPDDHERGMEVARGVPHLLVTIFQSNIFESFERM